MICEADFVQTFRGILGETSMLRRKSMCRSLHSSPENLTLRERKRALAIGTVLRRRSVGLV